MTAGPRDPRRDRETDDEQTPAAVMLVGVLFVLALAMSACGCTTPGTRTPCSVPFREIRGHKHERGRDGTSRV